MKTRCLTRIAAFFLFIFLLPIASTVSLAQSGPMRFLVGLAAGGAVDPYARLIADQMSKILGKPSLSRTSLAPAAIFRRNT